MLSPPFVGAGSGAAVPFASGAVILEEAVSLVAGALLPFTGALGAAGAGCSAEMAWVEGSMLRGRERGEKKRREERNASSFKT